MGVWIDTDVGFDDIAAILVVRHSQLVIDGVSLVFGNSPLDQVIRNAGGARAAFGWEFPIHAGRDLPVLSALETAQSILGETGIPTAGLTLPDAPLPQTTPAFDALSRWLETAAAPHRILALGPLTNIATLALARPELAARIDDLVWMGGGVTSGNHTASAEFNALADPEAVAIVLAHKLPLRMVDLDLCRKVLLREDDIEPVRAAGGRNAELLADFLTGFLDIGRKRGRSAIAFYDPAAAAAFVAEEIATFAPARIDMELAGQLTRGRTVVETRPGRAEFNAHFASDIDSEAARAIIFGALVKEAAR
jgi:purine nucleosidase